MYNLKFHEEAKNDLIKLNKSIQNLFAKKLKQILKSPEIGEDLGNKNNLNLLGLKKVYFDNKRYRIVYDVLEDTVFIHVIAVGKRDNMKVYKQADKRYKSLNKWVDKKYFVKQNDKIKFLKKELIDKMKNLTFKKLKSWIEDAQKGFIEFDKVNRGNDAEKLKISNFTTAALLKKLAEDYKYEAKREDLRNDINE